MEILRRIKNKVILSNYSTDFAYFALSYFLCSLISLINIHIINKSLVPSELGRFSYLKSLFELLAPTLSICFYNSYLRFNIKGLNYLLFKKVIRVLIISFVILFVIYLILSKNLLAALFSIVVFYNERSYFFRSLLKMRIFNRLRIATVSITLIITCLIVNTESEISSNSILFAYALGYAICLLFYNNNAENINSTEIKYSVLFKYCIPSGMLIIVSWLLSYSSLLIIKEKFGYVDLAPYAVAQNGLASIKLFSGLFLMYYPSIYYREIENKNYSFINKSRLLLVFILFIISIALILCTPIIYILLGAQNYLEYSKYFKLLIIGEFFNVISQFYAIYLSYKLKTITSFVIALLGTILNILLLLLFTERFGIIACCYSSIISFLVILIIHLIYTYRMEQNSKSSV